MVGSLWQAHTAGQPTDDVLAEPERTDWAPGEFGQEERREGQTLVLT